MVLSASSIALKTLSTFTPNCDLLVLRYYKYKNNQKLSVNLLQQL